MTFQDNHKSEILANPFLVLPLYYLFERVTCFSLMKKVKHRGKRFGFFPQVKALF
jgi:hypothetical protein